MAILKAQLILSTAAKDVYYFFELLRNLVDICHDHGKKTMWYPKTIHNFFLILITESVPNESRTDW